jgi:hypothetical protein
MDESVSRTALTIYSIFALISQSSFQFYFIVQYDILLLLDSQQGRKDMEWKNSKPAFVLCDLENPVEKSGASESVAIGAIIWGIGLLAVWINS